MRDVYGDISEKFEIDLMRLQEIFEKTWTDVYENNNYYFYARILKKL